MHLIARASRAARAHTGVTSAPVRHDVDAGIIGGGVIGLAVARALALSGASVALLEAEPRFGTQTSSRNSEGTSPPALCARVLHC
jgi:glycine/D-amino acid oxidase-like deaminating enzyme